MWVRLWVTNPVHIRETMQCLRSVYKKLDTKGYRVIKIMKQTFGMDYSMGIRCSEGRAQRTGRSGRKRAKC